MLLIRDKLHCDREQRVIPASVVLPRPRIRSTNDRLESTAFPTTAVAGRRSSLDPAVEDGLGAAHPRHHGKGLFGTIQGTGTAFHAGIPLFHGRFPLAVAKDAVGTDLTAQAAALAQSRIQTKRDHAG